MVRRSRSSSSSSSSSSASSSSGSSTSSATSSSASSARSRGRRSPARGKGSSPRRRSASPRNDKRRSPSPSKKEPEPQTRITVRNLSRNVTKEHVMEIFGLYGTIKDTRLPTNYHHPTFCRGDATIIYEKHDDAEKALKHMDGGQIDGLTISCEWVPPTPPRQNVQRARSPIRGRSPRRRSPRRSPRRPSPRRGFGGGRRSRSPVRRSRSPIRGRSPPRRFRRSPPSPGRRSPRRSSPKRRSPPRRGTGGNMIPLGTRRRSPSP